MLQKIAWLDGGKGTRYQFRFVSVVALWAWWSHLSPPCYFALFRKLFLPWKYPFPPKPIRHVQAPQLEELYLRGLKIYDDTIRNISVLNNFKAPKIKLRIVDLSSNQISVIDMIDVKDATLSNWTYQGLRASSLQFTSPLEFNAIFRDGFPLRVDLNGWSKIRNPVTAKFKHIRLL